MSSLSLLHDWPLLLQLVPALKLLQKKIDSHGLCEEKRNLFLKEVLFKNLETAIYTSSEDVSAYGNHACLVPDFSAILTHQDEEDIEDCSDYGLSSRESIYGSQDYHGYVSFDDTESECSEPEEDILCSVEADSSESLRFQLDFQVPYVDPDEENTLVKQRFTIAPTTVCCDPVPYINIVCSQEEQQYTSKEDLNNGNYSCDLADLDDLSDLADPSDLAVYEDVVDLQWMLVFTVCVLFLNSRISSSNEDLTSHDISPD